jgi:hypothetical protein
MAQIPQSDIPVRSAGDTTTPIGPDVIKLTASLKSIITSNNDLDSKLVALFEGEFIKRALIPTLLPEEEPELVDKLKPYLLLDDFVTLLFNALKPKLDGSYNPLDGSTPVDPTPTTTPSELVNPTFTYVGTGYSQDSEGSLLIAADTQAGPNYAVVNGKIQLGTVIEFSIPTPSTQSESLRLWFLVDPTNDSVNMQRITIDPDHISIANAPLVAGDKFRISVLTGDNSSVWRMLSQKSSDNGATWSTIEDNPFAFDSTPHYLKVGSAAYANIKWYHPKVSGLLAA